MRNDMERVHCRLRCPPRRPARLRVVSHYVKEVLSAGWMAWRATCLAQRNAEAAKTTAAQRLFRVLRRMELGTYAKAWSSWRVAVAWRTQQVMQQQLAAELAEQEADHARLIRSARARYDAALSAAAGEHDDMAAELAARVAAARQAHGLDLLDDVLTRMLMTRLAVGFSSWRAVVVCDKGKADTQAAAIRRMERVIQGAMKTMCVDASGGRVG